MDTHLKLQRIPFEKITYFLCIAISFILSITSDTFAQKAGNIWCFGYGAGLNFNTTPPTPYPNNSATQEGVSSISDPVTGELLFYTDGRHVYKSNNAQMTGSILTPLKGNGTSTQTVLIVPKPGSCNLFYIFTAPAQAGAIGFNTGAFYSIVDISLDGGYGDLTSINIPLIDTVTEKLCGVGIGSDPSEYWIAYHGWNSNNFYLYKLTSAGLSTTPVISSTGIVHEAMPGSPLMANIETLGYMKFSPNGQKIGLVTYLNSNKIQIFNFDHNTGIVSSPIFTDSIAINSSPSPKGLYGCTFSPDNSKFYVSALSSSGAQIFQYNLNASNIWASKTLISPTNLNLYFNQYAAMQIGPDEKIYVVKSPDTAIDVINNPNVAGVGCGYTSNAILVASFPNHTMFGLPNMAESIYSYHRSPKNSFHRPLDSLFCVGDTIFAPQTPHIQFSITPSTNVYTNFDSSMVWFVPTDTTHFVVSSYDTCLGASDTIGFTLYLKTDTLLILDPPSPSTFCVGDTAYMAVDPNWNIVVTPNQNVMYQNLGGTSIKFYPSQQTTYTISAITNDNCRRRGNIEFTPNLNTIKAQFEISPQIAVKEHPIFQMVNQTLDATNYKWYHNNVYFSNQKNPSINVIDTGSHCFKLVAISAFGCMDSAIVCGKVVVPYIFVPNAFSPNGDGLNDYFTIKIGNEASLKEFDIYNRYGQRIFYSTKNPSWDGTFNHKEVEQGVYYYYIKYSISGKDYSLKGDVTLLK